MIIDSFSVLKHWSNRINAWATSQGNSKKYTTFTKLKLKSKTLPSTPSLLGFTTKHLTLRFKQTNRSRRKKNKSRALDRPPNTTKTPTSNLKASCLQMTRSFNWLRPKIEVKVKRQTQRPPTISSLIWINPKPSSLRRTSVSHLISLRSQPPLTRVRTLSSTTKLLLVRSYLVDSIFNLRLSTGCLRRIHNHRLSQVSTSTLWLLIPLMFLKHPNSLSH